SHLPTAGREAAGAARRARPEGLLGRAAAKGSGAQERGDGRGAARPERGGPALRRCASCACGVRERGAHRRLLRQPAAAGAGAAAVPGGPAGAPRGLRARHRRAPGGHRCRGARPPRGGGGLARAPRLWAGPGVGGLLAAAVRGLGAAAGRLACSRAPLHVLAGAPEEWWRGGRRRQGAAEGPLRPAGGPARGADGAAGPGRGGRAERAALPGQDRQRKLAAEIEHLKVRDSLGSGSARMSSLQACRQDSTPRGVLRRIVGSSAFELFFCMVIVANAAWIGLEVNYQAGVQEGQRCRRCQSQAFLAVGHAFTALFAVELSIRLGAEGLRFFHGRSSNAFWNYFDTAIVAISLFEVFLEVASLLDGGGTDWANLRVLRIMRITRLLRVIRVTRIFRYVRALRTLVYSIACTLKSLFWASVLLMLIMYVFGILFTSAASASASSLEERGLLEQDVLVLERYWSSVGTSMFTLFKAMTSGVAWDEVVRPLGQIHWFWPMLFTAFIAFSVFAVLNGCTVADDRGLLPERDRERRARPRAARPVPDSGQGPLRQPRQVAVPGDRQGRVWHHHHRGVGAAAAGLGGPRLAAVARDRRRRRLDAV
ncbi:unnamed protein product, partial [Prorocentrum cordatum]